MRICQIVPSLEERHGGPSKSVYQLSSALSLLDSKVELFTTGPGAAASRFEGALKITTFPRGWPESVCPSGELRRALAQSDAEIVHHHGLWLRPLHYAQRAADRGATFVISPRGMMSPWAWKHHRMRKRLAAAWIHPDAFYRAHGWHATSAEEAQDIRRLGFKQPICVAPNGVRLPDADRFIATGAAWRERCPRIGDRPVALFYSRFHRKKRLRELFHLWLAAPRENWFLLIVGVPEEYSVAEIQEWIVAAGAEDRIAVFDGANLPAPYAVASLLLLPSHSENFGLVIAEAMAAGVPVLVTNTTPWTGLNTDQRGWCVPWEEFHRTLMTAMAEGPARLAERGQRARAWVLDEFSWEKTARKLLTFYQQLQGSPP